MLKRLSTRLRQIAITLDLLVTLACFASVSFVNSGSLRWHRYGRPVDWSECLTMNLAIVFIWGWLLSIHYRHVYHRFSSFAFDVGAAVKTVAMGWPLLVAWAYLTKIEVPRAIMASFVALDLVTLIAEKAAFRALLEILIARGYNTKSILVVGTGALALDFIDRIERHKEWGLRVIGCLSANELDPLQSLGSLPILGRIEDLASVLHEHPVDEVIFAVPLKDLPDLIDAVRLCDLEGVSAHIISELFQARASRIITDWVHGLPLVSFVSHRQEGWQTVVKRLIDLVLSATALLVLAPVFAVIAAVIKRVSPGPVFYPWRVVGREKKPFVGYKFRTMVKNADELKADLADMNEMNGPMFKITNDPRVTPVGRWLRRYSLDELPQLWSVLKGDMSLVGPRPPLQSELREFDPWQRRKLSVKPGLLCLREVNGRSDIKDFDEWVKLDLEYIDNWSLWLDLKILAKAVPVVLSGRGAH